MLTNEIDKGWEEIGEYYDYIEAIVYDGPVEWVQHIQDDIAEQLDEYAILDYNSPCFFQENKEKVLKTFKKSLTLRNHEWNTSPD
jgi:hypothetical protein